MPAAVESSTSTPNPEGAAMESSSAPAAADKKRNKLGYHRTSVACVHCRRRKIRCLVAADDAQGRCENCIRLRKECHFFPVDQQPPVEKRSRPGSKMETPSTDPSTASSSPPAMGAAGVTDQGEQRFYTYPPMPMNSGQDMSAFSPGAFAGTPVSTFSPDPASAPDFTTAAPSLDPSVPWDEFTTISDPQMLAGMTGKPQMVNPSPVLWSQGGAPVAPLPSNSPIPGTPTVPGQQQMMDANPAFGMQPDGSVWPMQQPTRSMTISTPTELPSQYPSQFPQQQQQQQQQVHPDLKRRMTSPAQGSFGQVASVPMQTPSPSIPELHAGQIPVSFAGQPPAMGFQTWQCPNSMPGVSPGNYPVYTAEPLQTDFTGQPMGHPGQTHSPTS